MVTSEVVDLLVKNARLPGCGEAFSDVAISDGIIVEIGPGIEVDARATVDARGNLVTPSYVNAHLHLCKVWTLPMTSESAIEAYHAKGMGEAAKAIDLAAVVKASYEASWIIPNARRALALAALHGNLHIRGFADVDTKARLEGVKALIAVREEFRGIVDLQVVAFAQDGLIREPALTR